MSKNEGQFSWLWRPLTPKSDKDPRLTQYADSVLFTMTQNGYTLDENGKWKFSHKLIEGKIAEFTAQQRTFFGPDTTNDVYSPTSAQRPERFESILKDQKVIDMIQKVRDKDEHIAGRLAFILGGVIRERWMQDGRGRNNRGEIKQAVNFCADMVDLGDERSADAIATAMAMYVRSSGNTVRDSLFERNVAHMAAAVSEDPISVQETSDLGMSQLVRLRKFNDRRFGNPNNELPDISQERTALSGFPTVGAEFHLWPQETRTLPNFWERVALLNMSQYKPDSSIQMSRNDRDVVEIRMAPSEYPVTVANWQYMRLMLPELNKAFFTITMNQQDKSFWWEDPNDAKLLTKIKALGFLSYSALMSDLPPTSNSDEINFGTGYLGQTVKYKNGKPEFSGLWQGGTGGRGTCGQLGLYIGYGDVFPDLAYYLSMGMMDPKTVLRNTDGLLGSVRTLRDAMKVDERDRKRFFDGVRNRIASKQRLDNATQAGDQIINKFAV